MIRYSVDDDDDDTDEDDADDEIVYDAEHQAFGVNNDRKHGEIKDGGKAEGGRGKGAGGRGREVASGDVTGEDKMEADEKWSPRDLDEQWMNDMKEKLKTDYHQSDEFTTKYKKKLKRETRDWFGGKHQGVLIGLKSNRDAEAALPDVARREEELKQLVEINRLRHKELQRMRLSRREQEEDEEEEEEERWWAKRKAEQRKEKKEDERRREEEKRFYDDLKETLWRERKSKGELRSTFAVAFEKFPIEDSSDEEVQLQWEHDNSPSKWQNVRWKCRRQRMEDKEKEEGEEKRKEEEKEEDEEKRNEEEREQNEIIGCFHLPGVRLLEMERQAVCQEAALRRLFGKSIKKHYFSERLKEEMDDEKEEMEIRREDRTNHRIEEMIRDMTPIPIRKASYKNLKALLEMEKEMEDQEELIKEEDKLGRYAHETQVANTLAD